MEENDKLYLKPGDVVQLRQDIPNKPLMVIDRKVTNIFKGEQDKSILKGMKCIWFTNSGEYQEAIFSTKDLIKIK